VICVADALIAAASALASCHLLDRASLRSASIAFDPAAQHWEAGLIALAPVIVCLSMFHQRAYSFGSFVPPRTEIRSATISWIYAAGLVGLASSGMLNAEAWYSGWPLGPVAPVQWTFLFLTFGLVGAIALRAIRAAAGDRFLTQDSADHSLVIGNEIGAALVAARLRSSASGRRVLTIPHPSDDGMGLLEFIRARAIKQVFVTLPGDEPAGIVPLIRRLTTMPITVRIVPDLSCIAELAYEVGLHDGVPVLLVSDPPIGGVASVIKRTEDIVLSSILIVMAAPLLLCAMLAIKLESSGPVFFRQPRHGFNNTTFDVLKLRTMWPDMEDRLAMRQTQADDPRLTRVGAFLRRHSLDELPQLFNVLVGDMSLVGPRPHAPGTTAAGIALGDAVENYASRHRVKPGITGWAQVNGWRGNLDTVEKALQRTEHDLFYIDNWSLSLDIQIILKTLALVIRDPHAY
jgi:exopolysaccharide biosynthesis polyprenyl glycosylphosphotransferase